MLRAAIQRPIAVSMLFAALVLIGVLSYTKLPVDLLPSITYPRLTVVTTYDDVPAEDLERIVTRPMEEVITALSGVRRVVSRTRESVSTITVEYEWGTQMDFANLHLREAIDRVAFSQDFPEAAARPVILRWDPTSRPISVLVLRGESRLETLTEFAREVVKPAIEQVDGISQAELVGGAEREILVRPIPDRLAIYDVTLQDIRTALARSNISFPGGKIRQGPLYLSLRISGEYESLDQIRATDIPREGRAPVRIADVAEVEDTVKEPEGATLLAGDTVVSLLIYKEPEANTLRVAEEIDTALEVLGKDYGDLSYEFVYRDAEYVRESFEGLLFSLVLGAVLAFAVLFFFLRDVRSPLVVGLAIPVSVVTTFGLLFFGDVKLNLMSLGGLSLAAGMLVDNAIVVLENVSRHLAGRRRRPGDGPDHEARRIVAEAAERGTREMARPVLASTLTTIAVFFPVVYVPGVAGAFFRDQALTVTFSLLVSVVAALFLQPVLSARLLDAREREPWGVFRFFENLFESLHGVYHRRLVAALRRPGLLLSVIGVFTIAGLALAVILPKSFMPERTSGDFRIDLELPPGTPLQETEALVADFAARFSRRDEVASVFSQVGRTETTLAALNEYSAPNTAKIRVILEPTRGAHRIGARLQEEAETWWSQVSGAMVSFREEGIGLGELLSAGEAPFVLDVIAERPEQAVEAAEAAAAEMAAVSGLVDLSVDRVLGTANVVVRLNREEILRSGLDPELIAGEVRNRVSGVEATTFNEVEQRIDIAVRLPREQRQDFAALLATPVQVADGRTVPLRTFLEISEERPVRELVRRDQKRMVSVTGQVRGRSLDDVWTEVDRILADLPAAPGVLLMQGGEEQAMKQSFRDLGWAFVLAVLLVYMILAAQFESFLDPFLIACVLPVGVGGAALAIFVSGNTVNILSMIGAVALLGIAVNDAIVKIDTIRRLREGGMEDHRAILTASRLRFRPILMTTATTVLAMVPMAVGMGSGEQLQRPLAVTIIGGLSLTTLITLFATPALYMKAHGIPGLSAETAEAVEATA